MPTTNAPAVLVTGTSRGLGAVMVERLAHEGYRVFAAARQHRPPATPGIVPVTLDVTFDASIAAAVQAIDEQLGDRGLFALVNNAAVLHAGPVETAAPEQVDEQLRTNIGGPLAATRAFLPLLRRGHGRIVNVSSINAQLALPYWATYSATKAALVALSDAVRIELAPWNIGVTVLTLGAFATDLRARAQAAWGDSGDTAAYAPAREASTRLVAMLDSTASDPGLVADAVVDVLRADPPQAHRALGNGIDDLLALAAQPTEIREAALGQLLGTQAL